MVKHKKIIDEMEKRLQVSRLNYSLIEREFEYAHKKSRPLGEIDLCATKGSTAFLFEMKTNYNQRNEEKAKAQLIRGQDYFKRFYEKIYLFECIWDKEKQKVVTRRIMC